MNSNQQQISIPWVKSGDFDATIGVFFDGFTKILVGVSVLVGVLKMPQEIVFGKIVVAIGFAAFLMLLFSTLYARHQARKTGNPNITALPGGISGGTFFVWLNAIIVPVYFSTGDAITAWGVGVAASLLYSAFMLICAFAINFILRYVPKEALMGALVGGSLAWLVLASLGQGFATPWVIVPTLFVLFVFYFGRVSLKRLSPAFVAIALGTMIAWITGVMGVAGLQESFQTVGFYVPFPQLGILNGQVFGIALTYLPLVVAFVFADVTAVMQSVEQALQSDENYEVRTCLLGLCGTNILGSLFGNPFPMNFYWGHPAWKKAQAGTSYPLFTGIIYLLLCATGLVAIATAIIPVGATLVMLIYAGICTGAQSFEVIHKKYYPAVIVGVGIPLFELIWGKIGSAVSAAKNAALTAGFAGASDLNVTLSDYANAGIPSGFESLAQGSMCVALIYVSAIVFIIDRKWLNTGVTFLVGAGCSFFGLMHAPSVMINAAPTFSMLYVVMALFFFVLAFAAKKADPDSSLRPEAEMHEVPQVIEKEEVPV